MSDVDDAGLTQQVVRTESDDMHSRTVTWTDPAAVLRRLADLSPDRMWSAFVGGELPRPPVAELIGFDLVEVGDGRAVMTFEAAQHTCSPMGIVAGGVTATVMDAAMWIAVQSLSLIHI